MIYLHETICRKQCKETAHDIVKITEIKLVSLFVAKIISCI